METISINNIITRNNTVDDLVFSITADRVRIAITRYVKY